VNAAPAIAAHNIEVRFGGLNVLNGVDLLVDTGERRALIGPNGAGKTTLFNVLDGHIKPTAGRVELFGESVGSLKPHQRARKGMARTYQITNLFADLTVRDNVLLALAAVRGVDRAKFWSPLNRIPGVSKRTEELLRTWELWDQRSVTVAELAYGQQRVLEIVMALASDPQVLLLDEPTAGLSRRDAEILAEVVDALPTSLALLVIEHDMDIAFRICGEVTVLAAGAILEEGSPDQVRKSRAVIETYLGEHDDVA
jgi:branched-chain amino acid transport system ATP-binding protein